MNHIATAGDASRSRLAAGRRVAAAATALTLLLVAGKGLFGHLHHSPALWADALHSAADTLAIFACWVGLKLADREPTRRFPFGLYRAETLASLVVSAIILVAGVDLLVESVSGLLAGAGPPTRSVEVLVVALVSAVVSYGVFRWEKRVGERLQSQSLLANADESRADILTSLAVFGGTAASYVGVTSVELVVAAGISLLILWLGAKNGLVAIYSLLDASLDRELESRIRTIAERIPGVKEVGKVRLRRAGPFLFAMAELRVQKSTDVARGHEVAHQVEQAVRTEMPNVEMLTVHLEPFHPRSQEVMVPAAGRGADAAVSEHFGRAAFLVFATVSPEGFEETDCIENALRGKQARVGLALIKEALKSRKLDAVLTHEIGEIAFHALRDHYVDIYAAPEGTVRDTLVAFADHKLPLLAKPTHASEAAGAPGLLVDHHNDVRLHSAVGYIAPKDELQRRAEAILAEPGSKRAAARGMRSARHARRGAGARAREFFPLTSQEETPMKQPAGETEAGNATEQPVSDSRPGSRRRAAAGTAHSSSLRALLEPFGDPRDASEKPDLPHASHSPSSKRQMSGSR